jgi:hypothetical protein
MYNIIIQDWGIELSFAGTLEPSEAERFFGDFQSTVLAYSGKPWGLLVDCRKLAPASPEVAEVLTKSQILVHEQGVRSVSIVFASAQTVTLANRLARQAGLLGRERYIDAGNTANWRQLALDWIQRGIDPDKARPSRHLRTKHLFRHKKPDSEPEL